MADESTLRKDRGTVSSMFDSIAPVYDRLNHILSFGIDRRWRRALVREACSAKVRNVLDVACGTGDVSIALAAEGLDVTGIDISGKMLEAARMKQAGGHVDFRLGDASSTGFPPASFDCVTIAFGIRNFEDRHKCITELHRVLRPSGTMLILEFSIPENRLWRSAYSFYFKNVLPRIGRMVSGQKYAYEYLPASSFAFPSPDLFAAELRAGGFSDISYRPLTGGVAVLYKALY